MKRQELIDRLNDDLAGELGAMIQYVVYAAGASGPYRPQLAQFFLGEVAGEQRHAQFLANKIAALGGTPTTEPRAVPGPGDNREMLESSLDAERRAVRDYAQRIEEARHFGDRGLATELEEILREETTHAEEIERILRGWPL